MEGNSWRPAQGESAAASDGGSGDWRTQLQPEARHRIVNKIMETLKRHLPISVPEGINELQKIAIRFEEKIYTAASNQPDYLRKISLKMLSMENKSQHSASINPSISNSAVLNQNSADPALLGVQSQANQGQPLSVSMVNQPSARQQILSQNIQNNTLAMAQNPANLSSALSSITGLSQSNISGVSQISNLQNMPGISQNSANNSLGQTAAPDLYSNTQRPMQGRQQQQQLISQQQHQTQNQLLLQHQFQQQYMKQKFQQSSLLQPHVQQQQQQQSLMQTTQLQSSQQPLMQIGSNFQSGQSAMQQTQPGAIQSAVQPGLQQNQLSTVQQSAPSLLQQHPQSIARQQQQSQSAMLQQSTSMQQQPTSAPQQSNLPMQQHQQQQIIGQQTNISNVQQTQLIGQQTSATEMQQSQRVSIQQNNLLNMQQPHHLLNQHQQQQLGNQSNMSGLQQQQQQQQQQQILGSLSNVSNMQPHQRPMHIHQQPKTTIQQQQQNQQAPLAMLQPQGQQPQHQSSQQQLLSQFQSQPASLQQQLVQQHPSSMQREMQQRIQASGLLSQNAIEQQKQFVQSQIGLQEVSSSKALDSSAQTGHVGIIDWQEEIYQKIKSMKELYFADLTELYQKIVLKLQQLQHDVLMPSVKTSEQFDKMKSYKIMLERTLHILQLPRSNIQLGLKDKLPLYEKQITTFLATNKKKVVPSQPPGQQQFQHPGGHPQSMSQQQSSQVPQVQQHDNYANQQMNLQGSTTSVQPAAMPSMQHGSVPLSTHFGVPTPQQNMTNALQTGSAIDSAQGSSFSSLQQGGIASMQQGGLVSGQGSINVPPQTNANVMSNGSMNSLQNNINSKQPSSNAIQQQHFKQEQQQQQHMQNQQLKQQFQQRNMQQQIIQQQQKQQLLQVQQPLQQQLQQQQQKQHQTSQLPVHQLSQLNQSNEINELKFRQGPGVKPGLYQQHFLPNQRHSYYQQLKSGAAFPISSPQNFQASSPQISHHSSPQLDQHSLLSSQIKTGTPLQSANSPFDPSPSTPIAPSPIPGDEKQISGITSVPNAGRVGHQPTAVAPQAQSLAVTTPGISASPLLAEFTSPDGNQTNHTNSGAAKAITTERPFERLIKVIRSSTPKALSSAVSDIGSVVSIIDRIAGSAPAPGNGSRAAVGEDLVAMTKCRLQARSFMSQDGSATTKKMKRDTSAMPLNNVSSAGSVNDSFKHSYGLDTSELESTATSRVKRQKVEVNHALLEEIREINQRLIGTVVNISEEDTDSNSAAPQGEGTIVKCVFTTVALCPSLKSQFASEHMSPILPLRLLVPANYPKCSPVLLDKFPDEQRESDDLSVKARSTFIISLRGLSQPMSLGEMARTWDVSARKVITEYARQTGGGTFSSRYGAWENCVAA
ncbi:mediator of RNA polymerase II transcription subunit 15a-like isoform X1 [Musa acuminata AAA Group]|uniref:mediator of RNA polymerase II transcription subunit 15a-like isoform X1 n=1 Tax=Musa acuminata AAA Group TaxID=214697 RepID=UPI0031D760DF